MSLGDRIEFSGGSYEVRGMVDNRYVVRIRNRQKNTEAYRVWTKIERAEFDEVKRKRLDKADRNAEIYERRLAGETYVALGCDFNLSASRIRNICANQTRKEMKTKL